jgi:hypothetical protein
MSDAKFTFLQAFESRDDLKQYGSESLTLFGLQLKFNIEDIHNVASDSITDGSDDKKCDLIFIERDLGIAVIAQSYIAASVKPIAKDKASDLNTAASWLLSRSIEELPELIRAKAAELRECIKEGIIKKLEFWYIHNCYESENISQELKTVELTVKNALKSYGDNECTIVANEIGVNQLEQWYLSSKNTILVTDEYYVISSGGYHEKTSDWEVFSCSVPANWIYDIYKEHKENLFSANIRSYLGSRKTESNINHGIKTTAIKSPQNFLVFNNGITALVNDIEIGSRVKNRKTSEIKQSVTFKGISIVNGAQTTGAIGNLEKRPVDKAKIPVRFVKCTDPTIVESIIRFNNSQNTIHAADFRSTDAIQSRLRTEFEDYSDVTYLGGRRGSGNDAIRRSKNLLASDTVAQSLLAFHKEPRDATHSKSKIWEKDEIYSLIFNDNTSADHIMFVYSLYKALVSYKKNLQLKNKTEGLNDFDTDLLKLFSHTGSIYVVMAAISNSLEVILDKKIGSLFDLKFKEKLTPSEYEGYWKVIVESCISFAPETLLTTLESNIKKADVLSTSVKNFTSFIKSILKVNQQLFSDFQSKVIVDKKVLTKV